MAGEIDCFPLYDVNADLSGGYLIVYGSLTDTGSITTGEFAGDTEFIVVDYDGGVADGWESGGTITVGEQTYYGNTPSARVWATSDCRADLDGDDDVDLDDIDPFVLALTDMESYSLDFPGLGGTAEDEYAGGSRVWHGDLDCDSDLDYDDVDPFVARVSEGCCDPNCGECPGGGDGLSAQQLAAGMLAHVPSQRHGLLRDIASAVADRLTGQRRAYWLAVRQYLGE